MLNFGHLSHTVQKNCHISDAQYADQFSMCIFLLKMREYYRWENEIPLSHSLSRNDVGVWLQQREKYWMNLENAQFSSIPLNNINIDPFEVNKINEQLLPVGYVYSGGYGLFNKPLFFLGRLIKNEQTDGITFIISSCEYARDLAAPPAMTLGNTVFIRQESIRRFLWEKIEEWQWKKNTESPVARMMVYYDQDCDIETLLDQLTENETNAVILHEIGEVNAGKLLGTRWEDLLYSLPTSPRSRTEHLLRAIRDHLADCLVTLPKLIEQEALHSLHFYFANFTGFRKEIFPQAWDTYQQWHSTSNINLLQNLALRGQDYWYNIASEILNRFERNDDFTAFNVEHFIKNQPNF